MSVDRTTIDQQNKCFAEVLHRFTQHLIGRFAHMQNLRPDIDSSRHILTCDDPENSKMEGLRRRT